EIKTTDEKQQKFNNSLEDLARVLIASGIKKGFDELVEMLRSTTDASIEFETAMKNAFNNIKGTPEQLQHITDSVKQMSTEIPKSTTEIWRVAEAAGQLGIKTENVMDFTRVMINLGATTRLSSEQAATSLAKFASVVDMNAKDYDRLGSVILRLGDNFAGTEAEVISMATRMASTGAVLKMTEPQIMAVSAALAHVGIEADAGSSAMSKLFKTIEIAVVTNSAKLEQYAKVAGLSAKEFAQAWGEDAVLALNMFINGLNDTERNGMKAIQILDEMGLTEVRMSNAILSLASSNDVLNNALAISNKAWEENVALAEDAETSFSRTEAKIQLFKNSVELLKIAIGDQLTPAIREMSDAGTDTVKWLTGFVEKNEWVVPTLTALTVALGTVVLAITGFTVINSVIPLITTFNAALAANPVGAVALAIGTLIAVLATLANTMKDTESEAYNINEAFKKIAETANLIKKVYEETNQSITDNISKSNEYINVIEELKDKDNLTTLEKYKLKTAIEELNAIMPNLKLQFDETTSSVEGYTKSLQELAKAHGETLQLQAEQKYFAGIQQAMVDTQVEMLKAEVALEKYSEKIIELGFVLEDGGADFEKFAKKYEGQFNYLMKGGNEATKIAEQVKILRENMVNSESAMSSYQNELEKSAERMDELRSSAAKAGPEFDRLGRSTNIVSVAVDETNDETENFVDTLEKLNTTLKINSTEIAQTSAELKKVNATYAESANTTEALTAKLKAQQDVYAANASRIDLLKAAIEAETATLDANSDEYDKTIERINAYNLEITNTETAQIALNREIESTAVYLAEAQENVDGAAESIDAYGKKVDTAKIAQKEIAAATKEAAAALKEQGKSADEAAKALGDSFKEIENSLSSLEKEYNSAFNSAKSSMDKQFSLLAGYNEIYTNAYNEAKQKFSESKKYSQEMIEDQAQAYAQTALDAASATDMMIGNMQKHSEAVAKYNTDLNVLTEAGFSRGFVAQLTDGSEESKKALELISSEYNKLVGEHGLDSKPVQDFVNKFNDAFEETEKATDTLADTMAKIKTNFDEKSKEILTQVKGFADGISELTGTSFDRLKQRVNDAFTAIKNSKASKEAAETVKREFITEFEELLPEVEAVGEEVPDNFEDGLESAEAVKRLYEAGKNIGKNVVLGVSDGIFENIELARAAIEELANLGVKTPFEDALGIHSRSKVYYEYGGNLIEGLVGGIYENMNNAAASVEQV
ncbi:MAG: phage tail tape measure protein, partial [Oscillospiraceae bacterium]|nr:phage tail tape measure protein [Oscillospiraceae bacterium]